ncbi:hypothetical protein [Mesorhizobium sp. M00.F.Ca.ET.216.01.1.1]|uniref:hypothetical protein n=1 Tax=Mesorhizobium sp. M00.F.Ca.ET.216.01.1.1 TaxID=2500528 RepID=UPI000FD905F3|nr:hypothetical protein [Mesorhizobium sp. M00.F.Ca.ET.216.01.1.1]TGQ32410.1 hypothetical protein EN859_028785 [Mesorhizobium sp. M00.F.Ca.ET.216.01.1.1]TJW15576.1 MAG: hypothetical protein E5W82_08580 [Mesorhizobium sp.]
MSDIAGCPFHADQAEAAPASDDTRKTMTGIGHTIVRLFTEAGCFDAASYVTSQKMTINDGKEL